MRLVYLAFTLIISFVIIGIVVMTVLSGFGDDRNDR